MPVLQAQLGIIEDPILPQPLLLCLLCCFSEKWAGGCGWGTALLAARASLCEPMW